MTPEEALRRPYHVGMPQTCAFCGARGEILYQSEGGWWCRAHEAIPMKAFLSRNREPLDVTIHRFIRHHS